MRCTMWVAITPLALGACSPPADQVQAADQGNSASPVELQRDLERGVLLHAIRAAGRICQQVTEAVRLADGGAEGRWRVRCENGTEHLVTIGKAGATTVADAKGG